MNQREPADTHLSQTLVGNPTAVFQQAKGSRKRGDR